jgi:hypothetical protein
MAEKIYTLGLEKIEMGEVGTDGGMGTTLAQIGYTYEDTCTLTTEDPTDTEFYVEELDDPVAVISKQGKTTFSFSLANPSADTLKELMGGTVNSSTGAWEAPTKLPTIEKSVKITPTQGFVITVPRMKIVAKFNANFSKTNMTLVEVTGTVLTPTKDGEPKMTATPKA